MDDIKIGTRVRITNFNSSWLGESGPVVSMRDIGPFYLYAIDIETNPEEGPHVIEVSENDVESV